MKSDELDIGESYGILRESVYLPLEARLRQHLNDWLQGRERVDRIDTRVKSITSFTEKAVKQDKNGSLQYDSPFEEIQDILGARVVVFFKQDADALVSLAQEEFRYIETKSKYPADDKAFGYFGHHLICFVPTGLSEHAQAPQFFELQVKTLFQHAWSQLEHVVGYKPSSRVSPDRRRLSAHASSLAWGADEAFSQLLTEASKG